MVKKTIKASAPANSPSVSFASLPKPPSLTIPSSSTGGGGYPASATSARPPSTATTATARTPGGSVAKKGMTANKFNAGLNYAMAGVDIFKTLQSDKTADRKLASIFVSGANAYNPIIMPALNLGKDVIETLFKPLYDKLPESLHQGRGHVRSEDRETRKARQAKERLISEKRGTYWEDLAARKDYAYQKDLEKWRKKYGQ